MAQKKEIEIDEKNKTKRQEILELLQDGPLSVKEISRILRITEVETLSHLDHIKKTLSRSNYILDVIPALCKNCGFIFKKRERLKKPGKCPMCKSTFVAPQIFTLKKR
ncbi:MAG: ArsR family transcriptional regulator [Deltaproteobacteria bacterium]|nr:ArsR family transcriptional regulator [Deltaproteobacteria bacterium]